MEQGENDQVWVESRIRTLGRVIGTLDANYPLFHLLDSLESNGLLEKKLVDGLKQFFNARGHSTSGSRQGRLVQEQRKHQARHFVHALDNEIIHYTTS